MLPGTSWLEASAFFKLRGGALGIGDNLSSTDHVLPSFKKQFQTLVRNSKHPIRRFGDDGTRSLLKLSLSRAFALVSHGIQQHVSMINARIAFHSTHLTSLQPNATIAHPTPSHPTLCYSYPSMIGFSRA